jgi:hypothetical protein
MQAELEVTLETLALAAVMPAAEQLAADTQAVAHAVASLAAVVASTVVVAVASTAVAAADIGNSNRISPDLIWSYPERPSCSIRRAFLLSANFLTRPTPSSQRNVRDP